MGIHRGSRGRVPKQSGEKRRLKKRKPSDPPYQSPFVPHDGTSHWVGRLIEAESIDGAWEELRVVRVDLQDGAIYCEATFNSFGPLTTPARFQISDLNSTWRFKR